MSDSANGAGGDIRVLVIDDSAFNRRTLAEFLAAVPGIRVVGKAADGEEGLRMALTESPDVITLDLEMPRMDGFTFLRILMSRRKIPVIVISSHAGQENVFRALELGAVDFVAKPTRRISPEIEAIREEVVRRVFLARNLRVEALRPVFAERGGETALRPRTGQFARPAPVLEQLAADRVVAIAASTGGPAALTRLLSALPGDLAAGVVVAQHMPATFTPTFADRLNGQCRLMVKEGGAQEDLCAGHAYVSPGNACLEVVRTEAGLSVVAARPDGTERYVPSADRLFHSAAAAAGAAVLGVVLTGMGDDGARGARAVADEGGVVVAESDETAIVAGMPRAAVATGAVSQVVPLDRIPEIIIEFASR